MNGIDLKPVQSEKDLGIMICESGKPSLQVAAAAKKASQVLGQLLRTFTYRDKSTFVKLYTSYVRPHLEYAVQSWSPYLQQDIDLLESVQKRAVRQILGLDGDYHEKLATIGLSSLYDRRKRGDFIQVFRLLHNLDNVDYNIWFKLKHNTHPHATRLASDDLTLCLPTSRLELRSNFFSVRVINEWNSLPYSLRSAKMVNEFKNSYDRLYGPRVSPLPRVPPPPPALTNTTASSVCNYILESVLDRVTSPTLGVDRSLCDVLSFSILKSSY